MTYPIEGTPLKKVVETGLPVIIKDSAELDSAFYRRLFKEGIRSSLIFPLEYKGKIIGTINFSSKESNHFSEDQLNFLYQISTGLAISIENSRLLDGIQQSEEKYRTVVESALDGVFVVGEDFRFKYVNEKLAEILGYSIVELMGMDFRNYLDEGSKQLVSDRYVRRQKGEDVPPRYEFNVLRKEGEIRNVEISSTIVRDSKGNVNTVAFIKDVTEKKKMEEQMIQNEKLRALGEMASGVAHDFNNALAAILGNTQLLLYTAKDEELKESLKVIEKVARDSAQTVRRLQDFTRKRGHQEIFKLDINSIVKDAIEITKPKWKDEVQGRGILIEMVTNFDDIPPVLGNAFEMREIVTSMIFNAIEAMPEGGKIEIQTFQRKEKVYIQISDIGIGMTEEVRKKVFEPFFTTKPFSNTGLGLSMSYGIIKRLGGEIEVESKVGKGTTFTIILPIGLEGKEEKNTPSLIRKGMEARVLVIDDEETVRSVLSRILSQVNYRVTTAENGEEGIRLFKEGDFDMVLTDLGMPGMSGWEVCKAIKEMSPHTPVGMITGWGVEVDQAKVEENGIDFIIPKPFQFDQILKAIEENIASKGKPFVT
jgi:PAS domain S-box-containing protein